MLYYFSASNNVEIAQLISVGLLLVAPPIIFLIFGLHMVLLRPGRADSNVCRNSAFGLRSPDL